MGLFSKKKTKVEKVDDTTTQSKIVKLTYLQSIAINQGVTSAQELTETEGSTKKITDSSTLKNTNISEKTQNIGSILLSPVVRTLGAIGNALFGKKVTKSVNLDVTDSGWTVQKIWNEPQFDVIRYSIGLKELSISQFSYAEVSEFISTSWISPKPIAKVTLAVDQYIPPQFPPGMYIDYYIKPEIKDSDWIQINPLDLITRYDLKGKIVPRIITFNSEKNIKSSIEESTISTSEDVKAIRLKVVFKRPADIEEAKSYSPILRNYRLLLTPQNGL